MPDDPDESFVINTLLQNVDGTTVPPICPTDEHVPLLAAGDDAAMVSEGMAVTVDTMVEGVHWDDLLSPSDVGWKLVACNASDINAMGGQPSWAVISLALPSPLDKGWVKNFSSGLSQAMSQWNITLVGGDTTRSSGSRVVSLTLGGQVEKPIGRSFATPNQTIWVSGSLGGPAAGFLLKSDDPSANMALRRPHPPIGLGAALSHCKHIGAMMDLSDGLNRDLHRLCTASAVGAQIRPEALPAHRSISGHPDAMALMTGFGEEYELLFTADAKEQQEIEDICKSFGRNPTAIGHTTADIDTGPTLVDRAWPPLQFSHFGTSK